MAGRAAAARSQSSKGDSVFGVPKNLLIVGLIAAVSLYALTMNKPAGAEIDPNIDTDKDGQIDAHELLAKVADKNNDGHVDHGELQDLADQAKTRVTIPTPSVGVDNSLDYTGDGKVDAEDIDYHIKRWLIVGGGVIIVICFVLFGQKPDPVDPVVEKKVDALMAQLDKTGPWKKQGPGFHGDTFGDKLPEKATGPGLAEGYTPVPDKDRDDEWKALNEHASSSGVPTLVNAAFDAVDSDRDGQMTRRELSQSVLKDYLEKVWTNIDDNADLAITKDEWVKYCDGLKIQLGPEKFQTFMVDMCWNAGINI
jgi:hypothetical protein